MEYLFRKDIDEEVRQLIAIRTNEETDPFGIIFSGQGGNYGLFRLTRGKSSADLIRKSFLSWLQGQRALWIGEIYMPPPSVIPDKDFTEDLCYQVICWSINAEDNTEFREKQFSPYKDNKEFIIQPNSLVCGVGQSVYPSSFKTLKEEGRVGSVLIPIDVVDIEDTFRHHYIWSLWNPEINTWALSTTGSGYLKMMKNFVGNVILCDEISLDFPVKKTGIIDVELRSECQKRVVEEIKSMEQIPKIHI
jgi:hypothetical protein